MIVAFDANLTKLIQMYVVGVFTSFTLSQTGMVRHWWHERLKGDDGRRRDGACSIAINAIGAVTTVVVLCRRHRHEVQGRRLALDHGDGR